MTPVRPRRLVRRRLARHVGERRLPVGNVARDRRLLRRTLRGSPVGRVLVVGPGLAARQALPGAVVDVAGTDPYRPEITVCSVARGAGSLPPGRWDTVIVSDPGTEWPQRLAAVVPACRPPARLVVLAPAGWAGDREERRTPRRGPARRRAWTAVIGP